MQQANGAGIAADAIRMLGILRAKAPDAATHAAALGLARSAMQAGRAASAVPILQALAQHVPNDAQVTLLLGFALRLEQRLVEADQVFSAALDAGATEPGLVFGQAQTRYELGHPAAGLFAAAQQAMPSNPEVLRNRAAAMASEGDPDGADALLDAVLAQQPGWLDGHKGLSTLRWTRGDKMHFTDSYARACAAEPGNTQLWLAWFSTVAQTRDWAASRDILDRAERHLGETPGILAGRLFVAAESGDVAQAEQLFPRAAHIGGDVTNLCRIRYLVRQGRAREAEAIALPLTAKPSAPLFWPYLSIAWRMMGDARAEWLDRPEQFIQPREVDLSAGELGELAAVLRDLHVAQQPYVEQSVRGGTQTDRSVLLRHEPILQRAKVQLLDAIRGYVADLPAPEEGHPLLGVPRCHLVIEGSWSVRLLQQGYNVPHTHPKGWLSTAFYISLPGAGQMGAAPAGHIAFGTPPVELETELEAYRYIEPQPGRIAIFPSTMWHGTVPFNDGERLVIALDIRTPGY